MLKKNLNQRYAILGMIKTMKLLLEGATRKVDDFGELWFDYLKTAKCMILLRYITYA